MLDLRLIDPGRIRSSSIQFDGIVARPLDFSLDFMRFVLDSVALLFHLFVRSAVHPILLEKLDFFFGYIRIGFTIELCVLDWI